MKRLNNDNPSCRRYRCHRVPEIFVSGAIALLLSSGAVAVDRREAFVSVTRVASPAPGSVNAYLIETEHELVVIDALRTRQDVEPLIELIKRRGKPLAAILLTHAHPDHIGGLGRIRATHPEALIIASSETAQAIQYDQDGMIRSARHGVAGFGPDVPLVDLPLKDGEKRRIASIDVEVHVLGAGESSSSTIFTLVDHPAIFIGDLANRGSTPWVVEGRSAAWLAQLAWAEESLPRLATAYPGHGAPESIATLLQHQSTYLTELRASVTSPRAREGMSPLEIQEAKARMHRLFPVEDRVAPMDGLEEANLRAVAKEAFDQRTDRGEN